jgi:transposase
MTGAEWAVCEPLLPAPAWLAGRGGRPASWCMRDVVDAIRYLTHNGPVWRALPADFPPAGTVYWWADKWQADGSAERMHDDLRDRVRAAAGRQAAPTAAVIDSQSVKGSEMIARPRRGYDAGNHAGRAVMPGWLPWLGAAAGQRGGGGERPGIITVP